MILIDYSQVFIGAFMQTLKHGDQPSEELARHIVLNAIRMYKKQFGKEFGEDIVLCCDSSNTWRKQYFPNYKASRKKTRDDSGVDWGMLFDSLTKIREELKTELPYFVLRVDECEADDLIATVCKYTQSNLLNKVGLVEEPQPVLIISSDKDFAQLQKYSNVKQYSPYTKKYVKTSDPVQTLKEHILSGDRGDGVPNVLSNDDVFVIEGGRQKPLSKKKMSELLIGYDTPDVIENSEVARNLKRNQTLIDLDNIPENLQQRIITEFEMSPQTRDRAKMFNYFIKHKLKNLMEIINEF